MTNNGHLYTSPESTNQYGGPVPPMPTEAPKKNRKPVLLIAAAVGAMLLCTGAGVAIGSSKIPDMVTVEKVVEKKVTVNVPVTPPECKTALDLAGQVISSASRSFGISTDMLQAAGRLDAAGITAGGPKLDTETALLKTIGPKYQAARDACNAK